MIFHPRKWLEPHLLDALDDLRFELRSIGGRMFGDKLAETNGREYLQLGCYETLLPDFLNTDFYTNSKADVNLDLRFPLPFRDGTWKGIYAHHVLEHLSWTDSAGLLRECHRVLQSGGVLRMVVPDAEVFLKLYNATDASERREIFALFPEHVFGEGLPPTPLEVVDYVFRDQRFNRHLSAWDWETAESKLRAAGFANVVQQSVNVSEVEKLAGHDKPHWAKFSLYVEAVKA